MTIPKTYLFYDIESSGLSKCFDQVLQFAAIRTDEAFNELARYEILVKLNPDVFPAPEACITHRIPLALLEQKGIAEYEAIGKIHALLNQPGTISLGYNTLTFDDEFLRFSFYRNLYTPYTHQFANGCSRMDIYPLVVMYYLYQPDILKWPMIEGRPSMKLEALAAENQFLQGQAHDAMVDVEMTLALAKRLQKTPKIWQYLLGYFDKNLEQKRLNQLPEISLGYQHAAMGLYTLPKLGNRYQFQAPVIHLGQHWHYKNQSIWLRVDLPELQKVSSDNVDEMTWCLPKKLGEPGFILPYRDHYPQHVKAERQDLVKANLAWLAEHHSHFQSIVEYHLDYKHPVNLQADVESGLYQTTFWSPAEVTACQMFHAAKDKWKVAEAFTNPVLKALACRMLSKNFPEQLPKDERQNFQRYLTTLLGQGGEVPVDFKGESRRTLPEVMATCQQLLQAGQLDTNQDNLLQEWLRYWLSK